MSEVQTETTTAQAAPQAPRIVTLSVSAAERIKQLVEMEGDPTMKLRIEVVGGGCSGFSYKFSLDNEKREDDLIFESHGVEFVTDEVSLDMLAGSELAYVEDMMGASFQMTNPNASSTCGCGTSFGV